MDLTLISIPSEAFERELLDTVSELQYPSETDWQCVAHRFSAETIGERFSTEDVMKQFFHDQPADEPLESKWAMMERFDSEGYTNFFRHFADNITQYPGNGNYEVWDPAHRVRADRFRRLRDLFMNHLVHQRWFRVSMPDGVNFTIIIAGQLLKIEHNEETGEILHTPTEWFAVQTGTVET